ncbi:hypothetical protein PRZ48_005453 [Zasmidium cellare]|uniref:BZIP domain-containing protein n=1 Tax=Zasmidium cellare TaxID=395010 RepID=A0ABR0ESN3_ZASCE|nr:hypothetical protein PRZ48_005453 [Zasmidium cellare]
MASTTFFPFDAQKDWFDETEVRNAAFIHLPQADKYKVNFEWTKWWAEVEHSLLQEQTPEANHAHLHFSTQSSPGASRLPPTTSPASSNISEHSVQESRHHASEQDETTNKAKKRKIQNREAKPELHKLNLSSSQRKCRDRRREQVLNLGERLRTSMAENKNLQEQYKKLQDECNRLKSENGIYCELLQNFWTMTFSEDKPAALVNEYEQGLRDW